MLHSKKKLHGKKLNGMEMSTKFTQEQGIEKVLAKKETLKAFLLSGLIAPITCLITCGVLWGIELDPTSATLPLNLFLLLLGFVLIFVGMVPIFVVTLIVGVYMVKYVKTFSYRLTNNHVEVKHGVFTKEKNMIPYSRIQNINVVNGIFDRLFGVFTLKIETAGTSGTEQKTAEGHIPGVKNPQEFEAQLKQLLDKYSVLPSGLEEKIFKPQELAFDNFVSYILSKMRDKDDILKTKITAIREKMNMGVQELAEKVGVKPETIELLEAGRYTPSLSLAYKIARELNASIEEIFIL